jgi:hypothetical protein
MSTVADDDQRDCADGLTGYSSNVPVPVLKVSTEEKEFKHATRKRGSVKRGPVSSACRREPRCGSLIYDTHRQASDWKSQQDHMKGRLDLEGCRAWIEALSPS